jgi:uncharacterized protein YcbX
MQKDNLLLSEIHIYPIKSIGGISLNEANLEERGLKYDRKWLLIDNEGNFITQRKHFSLAMLQVEITGETLTVFQKDKPENSISFAMSEYNPEKINVTIWDDTTVGCEVSSEVSKWFSTYLNISVRLVVMPDDAERLIDTRYAKEGEIVSFADAYPLLIIGQSSLDDLNQKLESPILMDRFRPNLVFTGGEAYVEDTFDRFSIGNTMFSGVKLCARCVLTTVDQQTGIKGQEPLRTLAQYRTINKKVMFGQNLIPKGKGTIRVGDHVVVNSARL